MIANMNNKNKEMKMKKIFILSIVAAFLFSFALMSYSHCGSCEKGKKAEHHMNKMAEGNQVECPVMGGKIDKKVFKDYNGKRIYFCCEGCIEKFKADPEKYLKQLKESGVELADAPVKQEACPVTGNKINKKYFTDHNGHRVYFCSEKSKKAFDADPSKYKDSMNKALGKTCKKEVK
jgi:YHS domain-containing protein